MSEQTVVNDPDRELVGYGPAAEYLGIKRGSLSFYVRNGYGPVPKERRPVGQYMRCVFTVGELDRWKANRPGRGFRSDLAHAGNGQSCTVCAGPCTIVN